MRHEELLMAFSYVDDCYLDIVERERVQNKKRAVRINRGVLAACIAFLLLLVLPAVAIAAEWLGIKDLLIPKQQTVPESEMETGSRLDDYERRASPTKSREEVESFAKQVRALFLAGDYEALSELIAYPIAVDGVVYEDREAFLRGPFVEVQNPQFMEMLEAESCENLFCNGAGYRLGDGKVWILERMSANRTISLGLKVTEINGLTVHGLCVFEGSYLDERAHEMGVMPPEEWPSEWDPVYTYLLVENVTAQSFDFEVWERDAGSGEIRCLLSKRTAHFTEDGEKAVCSDGELTLTFEQGGDTDFDICALRVQGMEQLDGNRYLNSQVPGHEFN